MFQDYHADVVGGNGYPGVAAAIGGGKGGGGAVSSAGNGLHALAGADPTASASLAALTAASNHNFSTATSAAAAAKQTAAEMMMAKQPASILHSTAHHNQVRGLSACYCFEQRTQRYFEGAIFRLLKFRLKSHISASGGQIF